MAQIIKYPGVRHLRADASSFIQEFRDGKRKHSGRGLSFWFSPTNSSLSEIPMDDRSRQFILKGQSKDFQSVTVQGAINWRVADAELLADRVDFTIDSLSGALKGQPMDKINDLIGSLARRFIAAYVQANDIRNILEKGIDPIQAALAAGFAKDGSLSSMGIEVIGVGVDDVSPNSELARALQAPTFESLQQQADEATFSRRALAVEKERAIAENELSTKIELEAQRKQLIAREDENARSQAEAIAAAQGIEADAAANHIRVIDQAKADMEKERMGVYADMPPMILFAMAAQEFAGKLQNIDNLTLTPDMLSSMIGQVQNVMQSAPQPKA